MLVKLGLFLGAPFLLLAVALGFTGVAMVEVNEADGLHLMIPVPMLVAQTALSFAPEEVRYIECPEFAEYAQIASRVAKELRDAPDFTMVDVSDGDETVLVRKVKKDFVVEVRGNHGETVFVRVPVKGVEKMIQAYDGHGFPASAAFKAFRSARRGDIVYVQDGDDEVRVSRLF